MTRRAVVVGAGIGGLTAGIALRDLGWHVTLLEQSPQLTEVGAGIQISPNGTKILNRLGLLDQIERSAFEPPAVQMKLGQTGRRVFMMPMGPAARDRWGGPHLTVHRADLISVLANALGTAVHLGQPVQSVDPSGIVTRADGQQIRADLIVGADGIHSPIRQAHFEDVPPRFTGNIAWRCTVPARQVSDIPTATTIWAGPGRHMITNWMRGGALLNVVALVEKQSGAPEDWHAVGDARQADRDFEGWLPQLRALFHETSNLTHWPVYDRAPLQTWGKGRIALMGDAAHAMVPSMAQGGVQAVEDAWVLAHAVTGRRVETGIDTYQQARKPRTDRVQSISMKNLRQFHKSGWLSQVATYGPMALASALYPQVLYSRPDWIYRTNPDDLISTVRN